MGESMKIYCCGCNDKIDARLTDGSEIYPHRPDLHALPFWKCDACNLFVGCHHKTDNPTRPLGCIPTKEIKEVRKHLHAIIDPLWKSKKISRKKLYDTITRRMNNGHAYHAAQIRSVEEAREVWKIVKNIQQELEEQAA